MAVGWILGGLALVRTRALKLLREIYCCLFSWCSSLCDCLLVLYLVEGNVPGRCGVGLATTEELRICCLMERVLIVVLWVQGLMLARCPVIGVSGQQGTSGGRGKVAESNKGKICSLPVTSLVAGEEVCGRKIHLRQGLGHRWIYGFLTDFNAETHKHRFVQAANPSPDIDGPMVREASSGLIGKNPHKKNGAKGSCGKESGSASQQMEKNRSKCLAKSNNPSSCNNSATYGSKESDSQGLKVERVANSDLDEYEEVGASDGEDACQGGSDDAYTSEGGELVDEWVCLGKRLFRWCEPPPEDSQPNPTFKNFPGNEAAIGWKVRVYWNEMGRWYVGHVRSFDEQTGRHEIRFCDGDVRFYVLRNEPVLWIDKPVCKKRKDRKEDSDGGDSARKSQKSTFSNGLKGVCDYPAPNSCRPRDWEYAGADTQGAGFLTSTVPAGTNQTRQGRKKGIVFSNCSPSSQPESVIGHEHPGNQIGGIMHYLPDHKGSSNGNVKEEAETEMTAWQLRPRRGLPLTGTYRNPRFSVLKARVGIFWEGDIRYYRGTIKSFNELSGKYTVCYDDNTKEDLDLMEEKFEWYGPRGRSNGYSSVVRDTMLDLGAQGLPKRGASVPSPSPTSEELRSPEPDSLVSKRIFVYWAANGQYYEGEILAYCKKRRLHLVWYKDGEVEWLDLGKENVIMGDHARGCSLRVDSTDGESQLQLRPTPIHSWGHEDEEPPRGRAAMGWRIAVFWKDDAAFYEGKVTGYNCATGRHDVLYDDNETENLSLSSEKVIWRIPPNCGKNGGTTYRKKSMNNGKSRASSQSDASGKERIASGDNFLFTIGSTQQTSMGPHRLKGGLERVKEKNRRNGTKTFQSSSKQQDMVQRQKAAVEGEGEVLGPLYPGNQALHASSMGCQTAAKDAQEEGCLPATASAGGTDKPDEQGSTVVGTKRENRTRDCEGSLAKLKEEVATNATMPDTLIHVRAVDECVVDLAPEHVGQKHSGLTESGLQERIRESAVKTSSRPGSSMSTDSDSLDEDPGALRPNICEDVSFDKKLPSVDVTRLVRLPPEFGSLEVKLRITAGASNPQELKPGNWVSPPPLAQSTNAGGDGTDLVESLQKRLSSIDHILGVIDRYEHAHRTLGHVASRCDQMSMSEVLATESLARRDSLSNGVAGTDPIRGEKKPTILTARESVSLPNTMSTNSGGFEASARKAPSKKQKKMPSAPLAGIAGNLNVLSLQTVGSSQVPPISTPCLPSSSHVNLTVQAAATGTSQFGVSSLPSIPKAAYGVQTPVVGCGKINTGLPCTKPTEMEASWKPLSLQSKAIESNNPGEKIVDDSREIQASTYGDGMGEIASDGLGRGANKNNVGN